MSAENEKFLFSVLVCILNCFGLGQWPGAPVNGRVRDVGKLWIHYNTGTCKLHLSEYPDSSIHARHLFCFHHVTYVLCVSEGAKVKK